MATATHERTARHRPILSLPQKQSAGVDEVLPEVGYVGYLRARAAVKGLGVTTWMKTVRYLDFRHANSKAIIGPWADRSGTAELGSLLFIGGRCKKEPGRFLGAVVRVTKGAWFNVSNDSFYFSGKGLELVADTTGESPINGCRSLPKALNDMSDKPIGPLAVALWNEGVRERF